MTAIRPEATTVVGGADTHADTLHVAAIDSLGHVRGDQEFPTTEEGHHQALTFLTGFGALLLLGVEGTSSYGAGFTRAARAAGGEVREVNRPEEIEAMRALNTARRSAVKARTAAMNQIHHMLITAPVAIRAKYRTLKEEPLVSALAACRPSTQTGNDRAVLTARKILAQRHKYLTQQADELEHHIDDLARVANPHLLSLYGVGPITAAQLIITAGGNPDRLRTEASFAALCGTAPVPASSGRTTRHRLSRCGDRAANHALHTIALVRMASPPRTRAYVRKQRDKGRDSLEILRLLKRAIARDVYRSLTRDLPVPELADLRPSRQAKNITPHRSSPSHGHLHHQDRPN